MNALKNSFKAPLKAYSLFLDRDGVINEPKPDDYVKRPEEFSLVPGTLEALAILCETFGRIFVVTNQQGIGRGLMSMEDLEDVHLKLHGALKEYHIPYFDGLYYAPYLRSEEHPWRKPGVGMVEQAWKAYPEMNRSLCVMVGDSPGDMALGTAIGATRVRIRNPQFAFDDQDHQFGSLLEFAQNLTQI